MKMKDREVYVASNGKKYLFSKMDVNNVYDDHVDISHFRCIRQVLLREVCRNIDIIGNLQWKHSVELVQRGYSSEYITACPFCGTPGTLVLNKKTGKCYCSACELTEDFFTMKCAYSNSKLDPVLEKLCTFLELGAEPEDSETVEAGGAA